MQPVGRFRIESEIGRGAMGIVHLAHDSRLDRPVAIKTLAVPDGLPAGERQEFHERFLREARAAAALSHPGIVTIYDADDDPQGGSPFIAMEYVPGYTLRERIEQQGELSLEKVREMVGVLTEALDAAHAAGIVHRDIKPANILVRETDGAVKIADFGVARLMSSELTHSGMRLGSPAYMSPEQVRGERIDGRSDLFSLAVVLYEALTGERPFQGDNPGSLVHAIAYETPIPVHRKAPQLPASLDRFFTRALAKRPEDRFATGGELAEAFEEASVDDGSDDALRTARISAPFPSTEAAPRHGRFRRYVVAAIVLTLMLGLWALLGGERHAYLQLVAKSDVEGVFSLLVDGEPVYSRELQPPPKRRGFLKKVKDALAGDGESFEALIEIAPGKHEIEGFISQAAGAPGARSSVVIDLEAGETQRIKLSIGAGLTLKLGR